ncbi:MAG: SufE family protein [Sphingomonadales bacterium]
MELDGVKLNDVIEAFELFDDWEDRYKYIIDLARKLPTFPEEKRQNEFKVRGCVSQVWIAPQWSNEHPSKFYFDGDSDAHIVKGLVALMVLIFAGKTAPEILATDARTIMTKLGLSEHLSPMRTNGLFSMIEKIGTLAKEAS